MIVITHTNGPFDGKEICKESKVVIGKHEHADIDLAFDPKVYGWVVIERDAFGFFLTVKGDIELGDEPLPEVQPYRVEGDRFRLKIGQSQFLIQQEGQ